MASSPQTHLKSDRERIDKIGVFASTLCAVHCAAMALVTVPVMFIPGMGLVEWIFTLIAVAFGLTALVHGLRREGVTTMTILFVLGISGLLGSRALEMSAGHDEHAAHHVDSSVHLHDKHEEHHTGPDAHELGAALGILAGVLLVGGHALNIRSIRRRCEPCSAS